MQWSGMESMECNAVEWNGMDSMECIAVEWNGIDAFWVILVNLGRFAHCWSLLVICLSKNAELKCLGQIAYLTIYIYICIYLLVGKIILGKSYLGPCGSNGN